MFLMGCAHIVPKPHKVYGTEPGNTGENSPLICLIHHHWHWQVTDSSDSKSSGCKPASGKTRQVPFGLIFVGTPPSPELCPRTPTANLLPSLSGASFKSLRLVGHATHLPPWFHQTTTHLRDVRSAPVFVVTPFSVLATGIAFCGKGIASEHWLDMRDSGIIQANLEMGT